MCMYMSNQYYKCLSLVFCFSNVHCLVGVKTRCNRFGSFAIRTTFSCQVLGEHFFVSPSQKFLASLLLFSVMHPCGI